MGRRQLTYYTSKRNKKSRARKLNWKGRAGNEVLPADTQLLQSVRSPLGLNTYERICSDITSDTLNSVDDMLKINKTWCSKQYARSRPASPMIPRDKQYGVILSDEYTTIMNHTLSFEKTEKLRNPITGNRIVELGYIMEKLLNIQREHILSCTLANIVIKNELQRGQGLVSTITLECRICDKEFLIDTENPDKKVGTINIGAVWGTLATGSMFMHMNEFLSCLDIPCMPEKMFQKYETYLGKEWKECLWTSMENAGKLEKQNALDNNNICEDGTPWITVYVDGSWSKRSYGTNFNALSGMVGIIGQHTGELVYVAENNHI